MGWATVPCMTSTPGGENPFAAPDPAHTPEPAPASPPPPPAAQPPYPDPQYAQPPYGQGPPAQPPYGQPAYGQPAYGQQPPYGQTPYGQAPQYGQAPYGQPPQYGQTPYGQASGWASTPKTDGLAIAALATSAGALLLTGGVLGIVGLILGIIALNRIRRTGANGRGLAIGGIVVGAIGMLIAAAWIGLLVWGLSRVPADGWSSDPWDSTSGVPEQGAPGDDDVMPAFTLPQELTAGTCLDAYPTSYDLSDTAAVDCASAHGAEVYDVFTMDAPVSESLDTEDPAWSDADTHCYQVALGLDPALDDGDGWTDVWYPHPSQWAAGEQTAYCVYSASSSEETLVGSFTAGTLQGPVS